MSLSIYIIDDEFHAKEILTSYVRKTPGLVLQGAATDPLEALDELRNDPPALTFLDVDMPGLSGLEMARLLHGKTRIVFTTSFRDFGPEAFELAVSDYLLKPVSYERFLSSVRKVESLLEQEDERRDAGQAALYVKTGIKGHLTRLVSTEILFVKSDRNYVDIQMKDQVITAYLTLSDLEEKLPRRQFCRVHRSYLVNLEQIRAIEPGRIRLITGQAIELGRSYKEALLQRLNGQLLSGYRNGTP
jgi:two-component system LytT family response regulator